MFTYPVARTRSLTSNFLFPLSRFASSHRNNNPLSRPSPPSLPLKDQLEFEELVRNVGAASQLDEQSSPLPHPDVRKDPAPEFVGDVNPKTGEVGGPKHDPLRHSDWSFGGRATDF